MLSNGVNTRPGRPRRERPSVIGGPASLWLVLLLAAAGLFSVGPVSGAENCRVVEWEYGVTDETSGAREGEVLIRITERPGRFTWFEVRKYEGVETDRFDVVFHPDTFLPFSYRREIYSSEGKQELSMEVEGTELRATVKGLEGDISTQRLQLPAGELVIEPLLKRYLARVCRSPEQQGEVRMVGWMNGQFRLFPLKWELKGVEIIEVPAGRFECYHLQVSSGSWYIRLVSNGQSVWLDASDRHAIVRTPVRRSLFGDEYVMVLTDRQVTGCPSDPDAVPGRGGRVRRH